MSPTQPKENRLRRRTLRIVPSPDRHESHGAEAALVKRKLAISRVLAFFLLIPAIPVIAVLALLTRLTSAGPGLYRQRRVGLHGHEFVMLKIRTMRQNAEAESGPIWATEDDARATRLGKFLRRVHLDELPQLFNVLRGEMCLVGPRPERPEIVAQLCHQIPGYRDRLAVPPGIAGLAQLRQGADVDLESVMGKQSLDLAYISGMHTLPLIDLRILLATGLLLTGFSRETAARIYGLDIIEPIAMVATPIDVVGSRAA